MASLTLSERPVKTAVPQTIEECAALREWAESLPVEIQRPATQDQVERHLEFLAATLPAKAIDNEAGKRRFAVYVSLLGSYSNEALQYMAREACRKYDWFPTPRQCLELVAEYRPPVSERETTLRLCSDFAQAQFDRWLANVRDGQEPGDVPESWMRIAVEQGVMRRLDNGSYVSRALYQGPRKAYVSEHKSRAA